MLLNQVSGKENGHKTERNRHNPDWRREIEHCPETIDRGQNQS